MNIQRNIRDPYPIPSIKIICRHKKSRETIPLELLYKPKSAKGATLIFYNKQC